MPAIPFLFRMHACIISNWAWSFDMQKKEGQLVDSPTRIDSFMLLWSSELFWVTSLLLLFDFFRFLASSAINARLGLKSAIDDQSILRCQSTLIASKCHRLDRAMLFFGFLRLLRCHFYASYDWNS